MRKGPAVPLVLALVVLALNVGVIGSALLPLFVTFAQLPVPAVACVGCEDPQVQRALAQAAAIGRSETASRIASMWPLWLLLALTNVSAPIIAWRLRGSSAV